MNAGEILAQAIVQSYDNRPEVLALEEPELLRQLSLVFQGFYRIAAKENPGVLAASNVLVWASGGWTIPPAVDTVIRLERSNGVEVVVVPLEDRQADPSVGAVYRLGRRFLPAGNLNDPTGINLTCYFASVGPTFTALGDEPGLEWPVAFDTLPVLEMAAFLAAKDQRADDAARLQAAAQQWRGDFVRWCQAPDLPIRRRFGAPTVVPTPAVRSVGVRPS